MNHIKSVYRIFQFKIRPEMGRPLKLFTLWLWGGFVYYCIELAWRHESHPSMFIVGGLCFVLIGGINNYLPWHMGLIWQSLLGASAVTVVEFISGLIINVWLRLDVWDYSSLPFNILGQVCLAYFFAWIPLSVFGIVLDDYLRWRLFDDEKPRYSFRSMRIRELPSK